MQERAAGGFGCVDHCDAGQEQHPHGGQDRPTLALVTDHPSEDIGEGRAERFTLSYRDVEDMLAERGLHLTYETVRRWVRKSGPLFAREFPKRRPRA